MTIPKPERKSPVYGYVYPCVYCGKPVHDGDAYVASKAKNGDWVYAHMGCAYPKKEADSGVRFK